jgi:RNA polymerase sigma-70 factor (ECF subfamily)
MTPSIDDAVAAVIGGDLESYRHVVAASEARVRAVVAAMLPERALVDDCVQEAFVTAYGKLREYRAGSDFVAWIKAIARNLALNQRRAWLRQESLKRGYRAELEGALEAEAAQRADRAGDALDALGDCLGKLQGQAREVVEEHYWRGVSPAQIAKARDRSDAWVRVVLFRARESLAECLRAKGVLGGR